MKNLIHSFLALAAAWLVAISAAHGQEEELQAALEMQDKRTAGLNKLADRVKNFGFLDYARKLVDKLDRREREVDPFGMPMDPTVNVQELAMPMEEVTEEVQKTTLQEAIEKFRVTGVNPNRGEVIVGAQSLRVGDHIVIKHGDVSFKLKIAKVKTNSVELVDLDTGELTGVSLGIVQDLPQGMTREQPVRPTPTETESNGIVPMNHRFLTLE